MSTGPNYFSLAYDFYWYKNALYTYAKYKYEGDTKNNENSSGTNFIAKYEDDKWHYIGEYKAGTISEIIPCDNDRFIAISYKISDNRPNPTPFARLSKLPGKTEIKLDFPIDHGQDELRKYLSDTYCFDLDFNVNVVMTDKYATLIQSATGLYWVFSLEKASLIKAGCIFKKMTPEMIVKDGHFQTILCVNPEKNGTILIAANDLDLMADAKELAKEAQEKMINLINTYGDNQDALSFHWKNENMDTLFENLQKNMVEKSQYIVWYRIYPENGGVEKLPEPPLGGTNLRDGGRNDFWRPLSDGSVIMGVELNKKREPTPEKTEQKDDGGAEKQSGSI